MRSNTFSERARLCTHPLGKRLFALMEQKTTNLALSADVTTANELLSLADRLRPLHMHFEDPYRYHFRFYAGTS